MDIVSSRSNVTPIPWHETLVGKVYYMFDDDEIIEDVLMRVKVMSVIPRDSRVWRETMISLERGSEYSPNPENLTYVEVDAQVTIRSTK